MCGCLSSLSAYYIFVCSEDGVADTVAGVEEPRVVPEDTDKLGLSLENRAAHPATDGVSRVVVDEDDPIDRVAYFGQAEADNQVKRSPADADSQP